MNRTRDAIETQYTAFCAEIGLKLAPLCSNSGKAYEAGTVLGIRFNTESLTWSLSIHKKKKMLSAALSGMPLYLEDMNGASKQFRSDAAFRERFQAV